MKKEKRKVLDAISRLTIEDYGVKAGFDRGAVHIIGTDEIYAENCKGILSLSDVLISLKMTDYTLEIRGENLCIEDFSMRGIGVGGKIGSISIVAVGGDVK